MYAESPAARSAPRRDTPLGRALKEARAEGIYSYQVAAAANISASVLSCIATGRTRATPAVAGAIADALGVPVGRVFPGGTR